MDDVDIEATLKAVSKLSKTMSAMREEVTREEAVVAVGVIFATLIENQEREAVFKMANLIIRYLNNADEKSLS